MIEINLLIIRHGNCVGVHSIRKYENCREIKKIVVIVNIANVGWQLNNDHNYVIIELTGINFLSKIISHK